MNTQTLSPLQPVSLTELLNISLPPRGDLLTPWLPERGLALLHGPRGIGKTYLALAVAHAVAGGGKLLTWQAPAPRRVLYLEGALPAHVLRERCAALPELPEPDNLRFLSLDLQRMFFDLASPYYQDLLAPHLMGADLIVVDNLSALAPTAAESAAESWQPLQSWAQVQRRLGRAVLFVHHSARAGHQRGTTKREDMMDTVIALRPASKGEEFQNAHFQVHFEKTQFAPHLAVPFAAMLRDKQWHEEPLAVINLPLVIAYTERGHTVRQIADLMDISKSTISRLQHLARMSGLMKDHYYNALEQHARKQIPVRAVPPVPELPNEDWDDDDEDPA